MKFFTDQDIYQMTVDYLKSLGYNILKASDVGLQRAPNLDKLGGEQYCKAHRG